MNSTPNTIDGGDQTQKTFETMKNVMSSVVKSDYFLTYFLIGLLIITIFSIVYYVNNEMKKKDTNNSYMKNTLDNVDINIVSINQNDPNYQNNLRDYYIMSSYNSCCNGSFSNSFVDYEPLKQVILKGARFLDFEVYSVNGETVIAASPTDNFFHKGTYNSLPFAKVMNLILNYAFTASTSPNFNDPLFLHFRIKSKEPSVYENMTKTLQNTFRKRLLDASYGNEYKGQNFGNVPLKSLLGKVIIVCDRSSNAMYEKTSLFPLVNMSSGSIFLQSRRNYDIVYAPNFQELINSNKKNMCISYPDLSENNDNVSSALHMKYGIQCICMNFQNVDSNLIYYLEQFNRQRSGFILKPKELRYVPVTVEKPKTQDPKVSFASKKVSSDYYNFKV